MEDGITILYKAVKTGDVELIKKILKNGADPNKPNRPERRGEINVPLRAIDTNYINDTSGYDSKLKIQRTTQYVIAKLLLDNGANPNLINENGDTILHFGVRGYSTESFVKLLLDYSANPNVQNNQGNTPMHLVNPVTNTFLIKILLQAGADPNIRNNVGQTAAYVMVNDYEEWNDSVGDDSGKYYVEWVLEPMVLHGFDLTTTIQRPELLPRHRGEPRRDYNEYTLILDAGENHELEGLEKAMRKLVGRKIIKYFNPPKNSSLFFVPEDLQKHKLNQHVKRLSQRILKRTERPDEDDEVEVEQNMLPQEEIDNDNRELERVFKKPRSGDDDNNQLGMGRGLFF
jgi:hypothetical protein